MNQMLHVFRKDLRRLRWAIVAWLAVVVARLIVKTVGAEFSFGAVGLQIVIANVSDLLLFTEIVLLALIVAGLVHDEPLVGPDAFWLTRPIGARPLMAAKLLFAALFLIAAPMVGDVMAVAAISRNPQAALRAAPAFVSSQMVWVSLLLGLAVVTPSLIRFLLTLVGGVAAVAVALSLLTTIILLTVTEDSGYQESMVIDATSSIVMTVLVTSVALLVIAYQYRNRRAGRAVAIGALGLVAAVVISDIWPWRFARPAEPDPGSWARDVARTPAVLDSGVEPRTSDEFGHVLQVPTSSRVLSDLRRAGFVVRAAAGYGAVALARRRVAFVAKKSARPNKLNGGR